MTCLMDLHKMIVAVATFEQQGCFGQQIATAVSMLWLWRAAQKLCSSSFPTVKEKMIDEPS